VAYEAEAGGGGSHPGLKNSRHTVFQGKRKLLKDPECKLYSIQGKIQGKLCFSGQAQVVQNSE